MKAEIENIFTDLPALMQDINSDLFRVFAARTVQQEKPHGFVLVHVDLTSAHGVKLKVMMARAIGEVIELVSQAPTPLLALYVDIKRRLDLWDGTLATYPLSESSESDMRDYYGPLEETEDTP